MYCAGRPRTGPGVSEWMILSNAAAPRIKQSPQAPHQIKSGAHPGALVLGCQVGDHSALSFLRS
ncbi:hypothetical protein JCM19000A_31020 [Silvimonas sp. JCM 19000]